jgi:5-methylcytosine-specific restriction endonuclease McrA
MKRSPIARKTPLRSSGTDWMRVQKRRHTKDWKRLRVQVFTRDGGACTCCGLGLGDDWECHHRRYRSRGGKNELANLIALCPACHRSAHRDETALATGYGWVVSQFGPDPADVPVRYADGSVRLLTNEPEASAA